MPLAPKEIETKINAVVTAWDSLASDASFGGFTLAKFKTKVQPSLDVRTEAETLDSQLAIALDKRATADQESNDAILMVVNSIKGDPEHGEDSSLYAAMGYVRKSERKTGMKHQRPSVEPTVVKLAA